MEDRILESYINTFVKEKGLGSLKEHEAFEQFSVHCLISRFVSGSYDLEDVNVGNESNPGVDGLAILVNDRLVLSKEDVNFFKETQGKLNVHFIFLQAKTSPKFDQGELGKFIFAVKNFFTGKEKLNFNDDMMLLHDVKEYIFECSIDMDSPPRCSLFYVTSGRWENPSDIVTMVNSEIEFLKNTSLFSEVNLYPIDSTKLKSYYKELKNKAIKEINLEKHTILPKIQDVQEAYIGMLPGKEFIKFISDLEGNIQKSIFYDNVRDFQGYNQVNKEINETISDKSLQDKFVLFNNGITIVAKSINKVGTSFKLIDYQIVNGCQTSHVLFNNKNFIGDNFYIPLKLIITNNYDVTNSIIRSTNRQTEVKPEAFESLSLFHKELEDFYSTFRTSERNRLYYERRSQQYINNPSIQQNQIITLTQQIKCFLGMFLNEPHSTHRYYGELLKSYRNKLFVQNQSPYPYYVSCLAGHVLEDLFSKNEIKIHKLYKYHMLMLFKYRVKDELEPPLTSKKKIEDYCKDIIEVLNDENDSKRIFLECSKEIKDEIVIKSQNQDKYLLPRLRAFTESLRKGLTYIPPTGKIVNFNKLRGFGFIAIGNGKEDLFFHFSEVNNRDSTNIEVGQIVTYETQKTSKGDTAVNISVQD
jgi:cold shock CspA family protein